MESTTPEPHTTTPPLSSASSEQSSEYDEDDYRGLTLDFDFDEHDDSDLFTLSYQLKLLKTQTDEWSDAFNEKRARFIERQKTAVKKKLYAQQTIRLRDKLSFVLGITFIWTTTLIIAKFGDWMPLYYAATLLPLVAIRYIMYRSKKWHYFLADLCYFVNLMLLVFYFVAPKSKILFQAVFVLANGPVSWAIVAWKNSLVFHSLDKMTSIVIHILPPLALYTLRWTATPGQVSVKPSFYPITKQSASPFTYNPDLTTDPITFGFFSSMAIALGFYIVWQALYYYFIMIKRHKKVHDRTHATSFTWLLADYMKSKKPSILANLFKKFEFKSQGLLFIFLQFLYAIATCIPALIYYKSFWAHTAFIVFLVMTSVFNGADYYFEVFSRRYVSELARLEAAANEQVPPSVVKDKKD